MDNQTYSKKPPKVIYIIVTITLLTALRAQTLFFFSTLEMNGGNNANAWLAPWVTDSILGLLVPIVIYYLLKGKGAKIWALLIMYSALGAFDYATGIAIQYIHPMSIETASPKLVYSSLFFTLIIQSVAVLLLFKKSVINHFFKYESARIHNTKL